MMRRFIEPLRTVAAVLVAGILALSCSANRMHRPVSVEEHPEYSLAFIEFDDQGELWAPSQLDRALALLAKKNQSPWGAAVAVYVHGWNNSAAEKEEEEGKGSVWAFRQILARLDQDYRRRFPDWQLPIVGVYLSWRGQVSTVPLVRELSFYNRRGAAERIAGPSATEAIYRLLTTARENPRTRSVLMGHSFGSMILERALSQAVISALLAAPGEELIFPADLVVLFNPAGSAIQTKQLIDMLARNRLKTYRFDAEGRRVERPLMLSFTSATDNATRSFFPLGMGFKGMSKKFRAYGTEYCSPISKQKYLYSHTAGHTPGLFSHEITVSDKRYGHPWSETETENLPPIFETEYDPGTQQTSLSFEGAEHRFTIRRKSRALNDTPYWIMQVPPELIPDHSEIFTVDTYGLIEAILGFSGALQEDITTTLIKEDGVRPVAVVPRTDGGALFLDRSRAVYALDPGSVHPVFVSCIREELDPSRAIGFHVAAHLAYAAMRRPLNASGDRCRTDIFEFEIEKASYRLLSQRRLSSDQCFAAAGFDVPDKRIFLSTTDEGQPIVMAADMTEESPGPEKLAAIPGTLPPTALFFESTRSRLFAAQAESGELWMVDLQGSAASVTLVSNRIGWPLAIGYSKQTRELYVTDAKNQRIWSFDCSADCREPEVFFQSQSLKNPTTLSVGLDGKLWLGDLENQTLQTIRPDGSVALTIRSLSGATMPN